MGLAVADNSSLEDSPVHEHWSEMFCLRLGAFLCFSGWAWVHFYWEPPYASMLWNESSFQFAQRWLGLGWDEYVGTGTSDGFIQTWIFRVGWIHALCALLSLTAKRTSGIQHVGLLLGSIAIAPVAVSSFVDSGYEPPALIEFGGQVLMPVILVAALRFGTMHWSTYSIALVAFVSTFAGHGCYAAGYWPTPPNFYGMTNAILDADYETSTAILRFAGFADFMVCFGVFIPYLRVPSSMYAIFWGFMTAIARPVAGMSWDLNYWGADLFLHEAVVRAPHFLIPLFLMLVFLKKYRLKKRVGADRERDEQEG